MDRSDDRLSEMVLTVLGRRLKNQKIFNPVMEECGVDL
jgi:hypothetical protein